MSTSFFLSSTYALRYIYLWLFFDYQTISHWKIFEAKQKVASPINIHQLIFEQIPVLYWCCNFTYCVIEIVTSCFFWHWRSMFNMNPDPFYAWDVMLISLTRSKVAFTFFMIFWWFWLHLFLEWHLLLYISSWMSISQQ